MMSRSGLSGSRAGAGIAPLNQLPGILRTDWDVKTHQKAGSRLHVRWYQPTDSQGTYPVTKDIQVAHLDSEFESVFIARELFCRDAVE